MALAGLLYTNSLYSQVGGGGVHAPDMLRFAACDDKLSANEVTLSDSCNVVTFTGTTEVNTINNCDATSGTSDTDGRLLMILCGADATPFGTSGNISMGATYTCSTNHAVLLYCDNATWVPASVDPTLLASALQNIVEDTTPQLGGDLEGNGFDIHLDGANTPTDPALGFGTGANTGFYESSAGEMRMTSEGSATWAFNSLYFGSTASGQPRFQRENASSTNPTFITSNLDPNTGLGSASADRSTLVAGGTEGLTVAEGAYGTAAGDIVWFMPAVVTTVPSSDPTGGVLIYSNGDDIFQRDSAGEVTNLSTSSQDSTIVASTTTTLDDEDVYFLASSDKTVDTIDTCSAAETGKYVLMFCPTSGDQPSFNTGTGNLNLVQSVNPSYICDTEGFLGIYCDGSAWHEWTRADRLSSTLRASDTEILYNDAGIIGGESAFVYDDSANRMTADSLTLGVDLDLNYMQSCDAENEKPGTDANGLMFCDSIASTDFWNGTFAESFDATVTESGGTVTLTVQQSPTGDLTKQFSSGHSTLDCTPACTQTLTAGTDAVPTENYVYVLESTGAITLSTTDWPTTEHIRIAFVLVPSSTFVSANGPYVNQNWNDHYQGTTGQGHLSHMGERLRYNKAIYHSGVGGDGDGGTYIERTDASPDTVYIKHLAGVVMQMHRHTVPAYDSSGGSEFLVPNSSVAAYEDGTDLYDFLVDSAGVSMTGKFYNLVLIGVGNKTGEYSPVLVNLPSCSYSSQSDAEADVSSCDNFSIGSQFTTESSTGFLIARLTMQHSNGTADLELLSTVDLRGSTPSSAGGGSSFPDHDSLNAVSTSTGHANYIAVTGDTMDGNLIIANDILLQMGTAAIPAHQTFVSASNTLVTYPGNGASVTYDIDIGLANMTRLTSTSYVINVPTTINSSFNATGGGIMSGALQIKDGSSNLETILNNDGTGIGFTDGAGGAVDVYLQRNAASVLGLPAGDVIVQTQQVFSAGIVDGTQTVPFYLSGAGNSVMGSLYGYYLRAAGSITSINYVCWDPTLNAGSGNIEVESRCDGTTKLVATFAAGTTIGAVEGSATSARGTTTCTAGQVLSMYIDESDSGISLDVDKCLVWVEYVFD